MIGITNTGGRNAVAALSVLYPAGAVCTCTKGTKTLTAKGTDGNELFLIPESGVWTVRAVNQSAGIDEQYNLTIDAKSAQTVTVAFTKYVFENGRLQSGITVTSGGYLEEQAYSGVMCVRFNLTNGGVVTIEINGVDIKSYNEKLTVNLVHCPIYSMGGAVVEIVPDASQTAVKSLTIKETELYSGIVSNYNAVFDDLNLNGRYKIRIKVMGWSAQMYAYIGDIKIE